MALLLHPASYTGSLADNAGVVDLNINVAAVSVPPTIQGIRFSAGQLIISGTNNAGAGGTYSVLTTTNLTVPRTNWMVLSSGSLLCFLFFLVKGGFLTASLLSLGRFKSTNP